MFKDKYYKDVFTAILILVGVFGLCRVTMGYAAVLIILVGAFSAIQRKVGYLSFCYVLLPMFTIINNKVTGLTGTLLQIIRVGNLFIIAAMMLTGAGFSGRVRERLPIGWIFAYCLIACISSIDGWMPMISYLKIFQFVLFLLGLLFIAHILQQSDRGLYQLRCVFMAFAVIFLLGSMITRFIPSVGYSMIIVKAADYGVDILGEAAANPERTLLFNGMTNHSQALAPITSMFTAWVLCDMLLVERRMSWLHIMLLSLAPILLFISRSRGGLLELIAVIVVVMFVCMPRARITAVVKNKLVQMMLLAFLLLLGVAIVAQVKNHSISKWLRKTDDVSGDTRSLSDAVTGSRKPSIEYNLSDFRLNPIFGKGFQVVRGMEQAYRAHLITWYSAAVEKGVTPYVILGETGLMGAGVFLIFLCVFYSTCLKRRYLSLLATFTCMLVANLADSTLFSPGAMGGVLWIISCVGGFGIDLISIRQAHGIWRGPGDDRFGNHLPPPGAMPPPPKPKPKRLASGRIVYE